MSKLRDWVEGPGGGIKKVAGVLKVSEHAVRIWLRREGTPKVKTMQRLEKMSGLGLAEIIASTQPRGSK